MANVRKLCPTIEELDAEIQRNVPCLVTGCDRVFSQGAARRLHMVKAHKVIETDADRAMYSKKKMKSESGENITDEFHCPVTSCYFNINSPRYFTSFKNLKSHYMKVHTEKQFECSKCNNKYRLERELRSHEKKCDLNFFCRGCSTFFETMNELKHHKETAHSEGISYAQYPPPIVLPVKKTELRNAVPEKTTNRSKVPPTSAQRTSIRNQLKNKERNGSSCQGKTQTDQELSQNTSLSKGDSKATTNESGRPDNSSEADALHTLASVAVERENTSSSGRQQSVVMEMGTGIQPCKLLVVGPSAVPLTDPTCSGVPILPKPHTLLLPLEYDIQDGNKFIIKTGPTVGICDPRARVPRSLNNNVLKPLKPKAPIKDSSTNFTTPRKDTSSMATSAAATSRESEFTSPRGKTDSISIGIQTGNARKNRAIAGTQTVKKTKIVMETETQTSGDYILRKAMKSANISTDNKSCGTQFSPRAHQRNYKSAQNSTQTVEEIPKKTLKRRSRNKSTHISTQTIEEPQMKKHKPCRTKTVAWQTEPDEIPLPNNQVVQSIQTMHTGELLGPVLSVREVRPRQDTSTAQTHLDTSINTSALQLSSIETQTLQSLELSHNTTQTQTLWDELEKTLAESISTQTFQDPLGESTSTQTFDSFLSGNNGGVNETFETSTRGTDRNNSNRVIVNDFINQTQNATFGTSFSQSVSHDPIIGSPVGSMTNMGHFGVQTDESPLSNLLSSSAQTSLFDDTAAFTSIETQTVDDMFEQLLSNMHTQTADNFLDSLELTDIQTQTNTTTEMNNSFESSTQTQVTMDTSFGSSHAESQTSVTMDASNPCLDMETQTLVTMDTTNTISESGTQTFAPAGLPQRLTTVETQTQSVGTNSRNTQSVGTTSLVQLAETETQTLLETLGLNGDSIHSETQTTWTDMGSPYLQ